MAGDAAIGDGLFFQRQHGLVFTGGDLDRARGRGGQGQDQVGPGLRARLDLQRDTADASVAVDAQGHMAQPRRCRGKPGGRQPDLPRGTIGTGRVDQDRQMDIARSLDRAGQVAIGGIGLDKQDVIEDGARLGPASCLTSSV